jgi:hypothetical protein
VTGTASLGLAAPRAATLRADDLASAADGNGLGGLVSSRRRSSVSAVFVTVVLATVAVGLSGAPAAGGRPVSGAAPPGQQAEPAQLTVRGSVEQIHVVHADPGTEVGVRGPRGYYA